MKSISTDEFIKKAKRVHAGLYDYSNVCYVNNTTPVEISCQAHGVFLQKPSYHVSRRSGCPMCYRDRQRYTETDFLSNAKERFGDKFSYGEYIGFRKPINIKCKYHALFVTTPQRHLMQDGGCGACRSQKISLSRDTWITRFNAYHGGVYDYRLASLIKSDVPIPVICPTHGTFYPIPANHIKGHGCPTCACRNYVGGYSAEFFQINPNKKTDIGLLYVIRCWNPDASLYKVGITNRSVQARFASVLPYRYEIIHEHSMMLYDAHRIERNILQSNASYEPMQKFAGWTECLLERPHVDQVT